MPARRADGFRPLALDAANFLLADVRGALGPFLNVFLVTERHWAVAEVGLVTLVGGVLGLLAQTPVGGLIDATHRKRELIVGALAVLAIGATIIYAVPLFWPVMIANAAMSLVGDVFTPAIAALTWGLYRRPELARRMGRNAALDHAGNMAIAVAAGGIGYAVSQRAVFLLVPVFAVLASAAVLSIPAKAINHDRARGGRRDDADEEESHLAGFTILWQCRPLLIFACCVALFHFANAPLLPLLGQKLALANPDWATPLMSACIIAAQGVMLPLALLVGHRADRWGRRPLMLVAFGVLPVRAALYTLSDDTAWLVGVQLLDGVGAGILQAITPLVIADLMRGTGRYNLAQGAIATIQGLGAATSSLAAGLVVDHAGYSAAFLLSAAVAVAAFALLAWRMSETVGTPPGGAQSGGPEAGGNASAAPPAPADRPDARLPSPERAG